MLFHAAKVLFFCDICKNAAFVSRKNGNTNFATYLPTSLAKLCTKTRISLPISCESHKNIVPLQRILTKNDIKLIVIVFDNFTI